ncbi:DUF4388 domain-containing protein [bacterium]|nr:DUF4388 domain-containing protein [bacterium]
MGISGTLSTMALADILQWLSMGFKTGILEFRQDEQFKKIYFRDGTIISAKSSDKKDVLGQILLRSRRIDETTIERLLAKQKQSGVLFGRLLIEDKIIDEEELTHFLRVQSEEIIFSLFNWQEATFEFMECEIPESEIIPISLKVVSLIMEGTKRQDDWSRIIKALPNPAMILDFSEDGHISLLTHNLTPEQKAIVHMIDGTKSIAELCLHSSLSDYETYTLLHSLKSDGILEVRGVKDEDAEQNERIERECIKINDLLELDNLIQAQDLTEKLRAQYPENEQVKQIGEQVSQKVEQEIAKLIYSEDIIPKPSYSNDLGALTRLNISGEEGFLLSRIDGQMTVKEIRLISGFSKKEIHFALYRLVVLNVIELIDSTKKTIRPTVKTTQSTVKGGKEHETIIFDTSFAEDVSTAQKQAESALSPELTQTINDKYKVCMLGTYYEILGVPEDADTNKIRNTYYDISKVFQPDQYINKASKPMLDKIEKIHNQIRRAFETLADPSEKGLYDRSLKQAMTPGGTPITPDLKEAAGALNAEDAKNFFKLGQNSFKNKDYETAYKYFKEANQASPDNAIYLGMLAQLEYRHLNDLPSAETNCRRALTLTPDNPKLYIILGKILVEQNRIPEAKKALEKAVQLDHSNKIAALELKKLK